MHPPTTTPAAPRPTTALDDEIVIMGDQYTQPLAPRSSMRGSNAPLRLAPYGGVCAACVAEAKAAHEAARLDYGNGVQLVMELVDTEEEALRHVEDSSLGQGRVPPGMRGAMCCVLWVLFGDNDTKNHNTYRGTYIKAFQR